MNALLVLAAIFATALARPDGIHHGHDGHVSVTHNSLGTYKYAVNLKDSNRFEERLADGTVIGQYTALNEHGVPQIVNYIADRHGFRILDGPVQVAPIHTISVIPAASYGVPVPPMHHV